MGVPLLEIALSTQCKEKIKDFPLNPQNIHLAKKLKTMLPWTKPMNHATPMDLDTLLKHFSITKFNLQYLP